MSNSILIIEDDKSVGGLVKEILENNNFSVDLENDGSAGLAKFFEKKYDFLITDVKLPNLSGFEICRSIREKPFGFITPIVILSVMDSLPNKVEGLCLGADEYLAKPFHIESILTRIPIVLKNKQEKLEVHPLTNIPSFTKLESKFAEFVGSDYSFIYSNVTEYYLHVTKNTQFMINITKKLADIFTTYIGEGNVFHMDGPNFCFFAPKAKLKKTIKKILSEFKKEHNTLLGDTYMKAFLHLIIFNLKDKKEKKVFDLSDDIIKLSRKLVRDGHFAITEKVKILAQA